MKTQKEYEDYIKLATKGVNNVIVGNTIGRDLETAEFKKSIEKLKEKTKKINNNNFKENHKHPIELEIINFLDKFLENKKYHIYDDGDGADVSIGNFYLQSFISQYLFNKLNNQ